MTILRRFLSEYEESMLRLRTQEETLMKAMNDAGRLADELRAEQEHSSMIEGLRKGLECQVRDLQTSLEEAEAIALRSGKKLVAKMETRVSRGRRRSAFFRCGR